MPGLTLARPPADEDELHWVIKAMLGIDLPRDAVCDGHVAPFTAVAHAYFGRPPNFAVWYASRGSGKSLALAALGLTKAFVADIDVTILGGSMTQSLNVREHMRKMMAFPGAPTQVVTKDQATLIEMATGRAIKPLPASQTTVRGPHPPLQLLDEIDEMDYEIYQAALGQAMEQLNTHGQVIDEYIVASSTWQNPEGTMTAVVDDARTRGHPVFSWCIEELRRPHGWMSDRFIETKRNTVSAQMWATEYLLGEPSSTSRAVDETKLKKYFLEPAAYGPVIDQTHKGNGDYDEWVWEDPQNGTYSVGADWAKERDKTVIVVVRTDCTPRRLVKMIRVNRHPWDYMIGLFNKATRDYQANAAHDKTGLGNVVGDFLDASDTTHGFVMVGRPRTQLLLDFITDFEHGKYVLPHIPKNDDVPGMDPDPLFRGLRATSVADVYAPGKWDSHLPDEMAAMALVHYAAEKLPVPITNSTEVAKTGEPRDVDKPFASQATDAHTEMMGTVAVSVADAEVNPFLVASDSRDEWSAVI